ncbi:MAG: FAD-dependent oxidoreductase [Spirochaetaceae bacterium]|nr:FAD-dependent oxidoreductase [Spirochaetaceae bacterium]
MERETDFIIIGAGAAGLAAAVYAGRADLSTLVLCEGGVSGGQALNILSLENYPGLFPAPGGAALAEAMEHQARAAGAAFESARVLEVRKEGDRFTVVSDRGTCSAGAVLLATGGEPRKLGVPGEETFAGRGVSYCAVCDGPFFRGKPVAVVGGGNSACDESLYLAALASQVTLIHRRDQFRADPAVVSRVRAHPNITIKYNRVVKEIRGDKKVSSLILGDTLSGAEETLAAEGVFIFAGFVPRSSLAPGVKTDGEGYVLTGDGMETSVPGLFCAGDVRAKPLRQIITAASDGAIAAVSAGKYLRGRKA